jgi:hypothetical protein
LDDRGHPDWQQSWEWIEKGSYGKLLSCRTRLHPMRDTLDPTFNVPFDEARYSQYLCDNLRIAHLGVDQQNQLISLIKRKWGVFRPEGMSIPVLDYECNIDTSTATPVRSKAVNFGPRESEIMQPIIDKLESIHQSVRSLTANGSALPFSHLNHTKNMFLTLMFTSGDFASTTSDSIS